MLLNIAGRQERIKESKTNNNSRKIEQIKNLFFETSHIFKFLFHL